MLARRYMSFFSRGECPKRLNEIGFLHVKIKFEFASGCVMFCLIQTKFQNDEKS